MLRLSGCVCLGAALATPAAAQLPPCYRAPVHEAALGPAQLSSPGFTVIEVGQLELEPVSHPPTGSYHVCASVRFSTGGMGGWDLLMGSWDGATFTRSDWVDGLNTSGTEFGCTLSHDRRTVVYTDANAVTQEATRASTSGPFTNPVAIANLPGGYIDATFGRRNGIDLLFFVEGANIVHAVHTPGSVMPGPVPSVLAPAGKNAHSPCPVDDENGETRALVYALASGATSDAWLDPEPWDALPSERTVVIHAAGGRLSNPDANGGTLRYVHAAPGVIDPLRIDAFLLNSAVLPPTGGPAELTAFAPQRTTQPGQYLAAILIGLPLASPIHAFPLCGTPRCGSPCRLGVDGLVNSPVLIVDREAGHAPTYAPVVPPGLSGLNATVQAVYLDASLPRLEAYTSNLASVRVR